MNTASINANPPQLRSPPWQVARQRLGAIAVLVSLSLAGCASTSSAYHAVVMQGQVLSVDGKSLVICIGEQDGAKIGQELSVIRHLQRPAASKVPASGFRREPIGTVRIDSIFDAHYSRAHVLTGSPQVSDMVELESK